MNLAIILATLYFLAVVDSACAGYRAAAGRNALIRKRDYYRRAMGLGLLWGHAAVAMALLMIASVLAFASDERRLPADLAKAGLSMLWVYVPYAVVIVLAFALRMIPSVDVRCLTSTLIFGPFVLMRPVIALAGGIAAVVAAPRTEIVVLVSAILVMMLGLEPLLESLQRRRESGGRKRPAQT